MGEYKDSGLHRADRFNLPPCPHLLPSKEPSTSLTPEASVYFMLNSELSDDVDNSSKEICSRYGATLVELEDIEKTGRAPHHRRNAVHRLVRCARVLDPIHAK